MNLYSSSFQLSRTTSPADQQHPPQVTNNSRCFRVPPSKSEPYYRQSFFVKTFIDWNHLEDDIKDASSTEAFWERLANIQPDYLHNLISVQSTGRTRSSSLTLARPPVSSSLGLQITNRSFTYASPYLWNQLPSSLRLYLILFTLLLVQLILRISPHHSHHLHSHPITSSTFHSRLIVSSLSQILSSIDSFSFLTAFTDLNYPY